VPEEQPYNNGMKDVIIRVQIDGGVSVKSAVECGIEAATSKPLTFLAYSDMMKARVLESFLKSPSKIGLSIHNGSRRDGEWHEDFHHNAIFNR